MIIFKSNGGGQLNVADFGSGACDLVWAHGWGQSHQAFKPMAEGLNVGFHHWMIDFPGFGGAPVPPAPWGTIEYAELAAEWLSQLPKRPRIWIGHSFGCRVGIRLAGRHAGLLDGLVLVSAAGIRPPQSVAKRATGFLRARAFRTLRWLARSEAERERLRNRWGSADYRSAGEMRATLVRVVNEDLSADARHVDVPVRLIYGENDAETPVWVGKRFEALMPRASLYILPRFGHLDILVNGRFQVQSLVQEFASTICR